MQPTRRSFLKGVLAASVASPFLLPRGAAAVEPPSRPGAARLLPGLAAYSFRQYFTDSSHKQEPGTKHEKIDLFQFVDFCATHGCVGAELTSYYFPKNLTTDFLLKLRRHAFLRGIVLSGSAVGNDFTHADDAKRVAQVALVKKWVDHSQLLGAPHIRVFAGGSDIREPEAARMRVIQALEECGEYAGQRGIFLGLENHGGIVAEADNLLQIVKSVKSPWVGINLDTGNFHTDDPYGDLERCAPYAVNVQLKVEIQPRGKPKTLSDLPRLVKILREAHYQGFVTLEYEAAEDPWEAVPLWLAKLNPLLRSEPA